MLGFLDFSFLLCFQFAQPQAPPKEAKESILSLYGQGQPQMAMGMGAAVPNGMSAGQMAYQQQVYMQQQMQQQAMMQQQMAMQQQQMAMQQQAMQVGGDYNSLMLCVLQGLKCCAYNFRWRVCDNCWDFLC